MSKARRLSVLLLVTAGLLFAPAATAQQNSIQNPYESTPTTLYFHIFDTVNKFVINTQAMDSNVFEVGGANFPSTPDFDVTDPGTGLPTENGWDLNTIYGYSTAGPVEYGFIENGRPRFHPERGIAATVDIDGDATNENCEALGEPGAACVVMYIDSRDAFGTKAAPTLSPQYHLRITIREGDNPGLNANLDNGRLIMDGLKVFHIADASFRGGAVAGALSPAEGSANDGVEGQEDPVTNTPVLTPGEDGYIEVVVPIEIAQDFIPKTEAYNVRIDWYQKGPDGTEDAIEPDQFANGWLRLGIDPDHLPRLEMNIMNPIYFSFIHPQVAANTLLIHAGGNSPWGTYDVDLGNTTVKVTHVETGKVVPDAQLKKILNSNEHVHGLHDEDAQFTYLWDFREHGAALGEYLIEMSVNNDAGTSLATGSAKFVVSETEAFGVDTEGNVVESSFSEEEVDTPSVGVIPALALLGAGLLFARRRLQE